MPLADYSGLSSSASSLWDQAFNIGRNAVWAPDPTTQVVTNAVIVAIMMLSSSIGFVVGIPIAMAALFLLGVGVVRILVGWVM